MTSVRKRPVPPRRLGEVMPLKGCAGSSARAVATFSVPGAGTGRR